MVWIAIRNRSIHLSCFDELLPPMVQIWFQFSKGPYCRGQESVWGQERHTHEDCIKLKTILNALYFQQHPFKFQNVPIIPNHFAGEIFTTVWMSFMLRREKKVHVSKKKVKKKQGRRFRKSRSAVWYFWDLYIQQRHFFLIYLLLLLLWGCETYLNSRGDKCFKGTKFLKRTESLFLQ